MKFRTKDEEIICKDALYAADSGTTAIKSSVTNSIIVPFAAAIKTPNEFIPFLTSVPPLLGSFIQIFSPDLLNIVKNRKIIIVSAALLDAITWIPIMLIPFFWEGNYFLLLNLLIIQAMAIAFLNPFYNSYLGDVIPQEKRATVLGKINKIAGTVSFTATLLCGFILSSFSKLNPYIGFLIVFFIAFFSKIISVSIKMRFKDVEPKFVSHESFRKFSKNLNKNNFGKFALYVSLMRFATGISSPFIAVYLLNSLGVDYFMYSLIIAASMISAILFFTKIAEYIDRKGSRKILSLSGYLVSIIPLGWVLFKNPYILIITQFFSGLVWSSFNLSVSNFIMDSTLPKNRLALSSYFNFFSGLFTFFGAILGGYMMRHLPINYYGNLFLFLFFLSSVLRLIFTKIFMPQIHEERYVRIKLGEDKIVSLQPHNQGLGYEEIRRQN